MTPAGRESTRGWRQLHPALARDLSDARLQLHHAAQLVSAIGISYLPHERDDGHTNLEWLEGVAALSSHPVAGSSPIRLAVRPHPFAILLLGAEEERGSFALHGRTVDEAAVWIREQIASFGLDAAKYTWRSISRFLHMQSANPRHSMRARRLRSTSLRRGTRTPR